MTRTRAPHPARAVRRVSRGQGHAHGHARHALHTQRGVAAVEFAFVFPLFFVVLYAIVAYCLILLANMAMSGATQEGARAALASAGQTTLTAEYAARLQNACTRASALMTWLPSAASSASCTQSACGPSNAMVCVTVSMQYDYASQPIVPNLPLLGFVTPNTLGAQATVQLDPASIMSNM
ncbi:pilus assembly protein [Pararobbsia silviterrae]|uniref:Pilus assembly protein n=2 Tax=Pararobbsia silviterrae TaxID=1792498 RepID=A0A494XNR2_9BURK|nr:pilus assembly protein [Pararobbsia silviterrae]